MPATPTYIAKPRNPRGHREFLVHLKDALERNRCRENAALLAVVTLHTPGDPAIFCTGDGHIWPCTTITTVYAAFGLGDLP